MTHFVIIIIMIKNGSKMWHSKATVIPAVIGALGMIKKKTEDHIKQIQGNPCLQEFLPLSSAEFTTGMLSVKTLDRNQSLSNAQSLYFHTNGPK